MAAADVFVDSAGFLALWDSSDAHHVRATKIQQDLARKRRRFLTSEYVIDCGEVLYEVGELTEATP